MTMSRRYPPEVLGVGVQGLLSVIEGDGRGIEAIIATGTGAQLQELWDVESEDLESAQPRNVRWGHEVVDGAVEGDVLGIAESYAHADDAYLRVDRAGICRELGDRALRCGMGVADETSWKFDYRVFCVLAIAGIFAGLQDSILDREVDLNVGMTTRLSCGGKRRVFGDRSVCLRGGGDRSKSSQHASGHCKRNRRRSQGISDRRDADSPSSVFVRSLKRRPHRQDKRERVARSNQRVNHFAPPPRLRRAT